MLLLLRATMSGWSLLVLAREAFAQPAASQVPVNPPTGSNLPMTLNPVPDNQFILTLVFILFGLIMIVLQITSLRRIPSVVADDIARNCAITTVVTASLVLIFAGYSSQQIAPAFGLFGTIVGYLLVEQI
jgi:hypothetical protein